MEGPTIIIVYGCNFDCSHCVVSKTHKFSYISIETFKKIMQELSSLGFDLVGITAAGEITLHPKLDEIIKIAFNQGIKLDLLTNGWLFNEKLLPILSDHNYSKAIVRIGFSLDAPYEEIHDELRKKGSFKKIMEAISYCSLYGIPVYLKTAIRKSNINYIDDMIKFAASLGIEQIRFISPMPTEKLVRSDEIPSPMTIKEEIKPRLETLQMISDEFVFWEGWCEDRPSPIFPCNAFSKISIDYSGYSIFCSLLSGTGDSSIYNERIVNLNTTSIGNALTRHFEILSKVVEWRLKIKDLIIKGNYPICYWCYYQFGRLSWLKNYPSSPWARGIIEAEKRGIKPMS